MNFITKTQRMGIAALLMSGSILLSRFMGLFRDKVVSWEFGASPEADLYFVAFVIPDFINYLLAGGYISITLIPILAKRFEEDINDAWRLFSVILFWTSIISCFMTAIAWYYAEQLAALIAPGFEPEQIQRLAYFMRIILPAQAFFLIGSCFSALLFLRQQFIIPAITPLIYNGFIILCGLFLPFTGMDGFCIGVTVGAFLGAFILPWWAAKMGGLNLYFGFKHKLIKTFLILALPLMVGQSIIMLDEQFLRIFGSMAEDGAISLLSYARRIANVPVSVIGQAVAVASYPFLAALVAKNEKAQFSKSLNRAINNSLIFCIPISLLMLALSLPIMNFIFYGGNFGLDETYKSSPLLKIMMIAVPLWSVQALIGRAFYAHKDTLTPALIGTIITVASIPFFAYAPDKWGSMGIAVLSTLCVVIYIISITIVWIRRHGSDAFQNTVNISFKATLFSAIAAAPTYYVSLKCMAIDITFLQDLSSLQALITLLIASSIFIIIYLPLCLKLAPELILPMAERIRKRG